MFETEEFLIAIREEGSELVRDSLDGVASKFNDVVQEVSAGADQMEGFSERYAGAAAVAVTGLTIAAAGLLSQVPIIGSVFEAFGGIIEAVAYQMDRVLRPALKPVLMFFYDLEAAIYDAEGPFGTLIGVVGTVAAVLGTLLGTATLIAAQFLGWPAVFAAATVAVKAIIGAIAGVVGAIVGLPVAVALALAAFIAFVAAYLTNWRGTRDKTNEIVGQIWGYITGLGDDLVAWAKGLDLSDFVSAFNDIGSDVNEYLDDLATAMLQKGKDIINNLVEGIRLALSGTAGFISDLITGGSQEFNADVSGAGGADSRPGPQRTGPYNQPSNYTVNLSLDDSAVAQANSRATTRSTNANGGISR